MAKFEEDKIITPLHPEKAESGKEYYFSDELLDLKKEVEKGKNHSNLEYVVKDAEYPFSLINDDWQFLYPYEEPPKQRMTKRMLAEWLAKGKGLMKYDNPVCTISISYLENQLEEEVGDTVLIKSWDSEEWIEPTVDIYERDCKGGKE